MKLDPEVYNVSGEANYSVAVATQLFLELLVMESWQNTLDAGRKTMNYQDIATAINEIHEFEFLTELVPQTIKYDEAIEKRRALEEAQHAANEDE